MLVRTRKEYSTKHFSCKCKSFQDKIVQLLRDSHGKRLKTLRVLGELTLNFSENVKGPTSCTYFIHLNMSLIYILLYKIHTHIHMVNVFSGEVLIHKLMSSQDHIQQRQEHVRCLVQLIQIYLTQIASNPHSQQEHNNTPQHITCISDDQI